MKGKFMIMDYWGQKMLLDDLSLQMKTLIDLLINT